MSGACPAGNRVPPPPQPIAEPRVASASHGWNSATCSLTQQCVVHPRSVECHATRGRGVPRVLGAVLMASRRRVEVVRTVPVRTRATSTSEPILRRSESCTYVATSWYNRSSWNRVHAVSLRGHTRAGWSAAWLDVQDIHPGERPQRQPRSYSTDDLSSLTIISRMQIVSPVSPCAEREVLSRTSRDAGVEVE